MNSQNKCGNCYSKIKNVNDKRLLSSFFSFFLLLYSLLDEANQKKEKRANQVMKH